MPDCDNFDNTSNKSIGGYKDVVIIGNGPSGISLSYFLSGHWPHWNKNKVSDEYLQMRLEYCDNGKSLLEQVGFKNDSPSSTSSEFSWLKQIFYFRIWNIYATDWRVAQRILSHYCLTA